MKLRNNLTLEEQEARRCAKQDIISDKDINKNYRATQHMLANPKLFVGSMPNNRVMTESYVGY